MSWGVIRLCIPLKFLTLPYLELFMFVLAGIPDMRQWAILRSLCVGSAGSDGCDTLQTQVSLHGLVSHLAGLFSGSAGLDCQRNLRTHALPHGPCTCYVMCHFFISIFFVTCFILITCIFIWVAPPSGVDVPWLRQPGRFPLTNSVQ